MVCIERKGSSGQMHEELDGVLMQNNSSKAGQPSALNASLLFSRSQQEETLSGLMTN